MSKMLASNPLGIRASVAIAAAVIAGVGATPALAALTPSQQAATAAGQAAFQCFAHDCSGRKLIGVSGPRRGVMTYGYRYTGMHGVHGHPYYSRCDQLIMVNQQGGIGQFRFYNCV
jgi:hypothetical protein